MSEPTAFEQAAERHAGGEDHHALAAELVNAMTLAEKLDCLDGDTDFWPGLMDMTAGGYHQHPWPAAAVERLGVPGIDFVDGPRGCVVGPATCFPVSMARGATFDPELEERIGEVIGAEIRAIGGTFTGAVCVNLLRHPGWGRAQETYGEEPHHVGEMGAALTRGLQRHVLACMKHYALNSMENARFTVDVIADERALHEVYLPHFRRIAAEGVASTMSAYNSVNGTWCGDDRVLLTEILRDEWGWDGFVITDFIFGLRDPAGSVRAGCDIEMPFRQQRHGALAEAVADGALAEADVDAAVTRTVATLLRFADLLGEPTDPVELAAPAHRALARETAVAGTVLLRNDAVLPIDPSAVRDVAVLGRLAAVPNLGDGGSSNVLQPDVITPLQGLRDVLPGAEVRHHDDDAGLAAGADLTLVVVGTTKDDEGEFIDAAGTAEMMAMFPPPPEQAPPLPDLGDAEAPPADEEEPERTGFAPGGDRRSLRLSAEDEALIAAAVEHARGPVVVAVMGGSAFVMPWLDDVGAALQIWYPGMVGGTALGDVVTGAAEPGGRLPFAVPHDEADLVDFDPDATTADYGLFHGHWHLEREGIEPHLPFGHGLGYTELTIAEAALSSVGESVDVVVANEGHRDGSTVVFAFAGLPTSAHARPTGRLVGFRRVAVTAGEQVEVSVPIDWAQLDLRLDGEWVTEPGRYRLQIGQHAADAAAVIDVDR
ncbi:MAG: glycoside hydrolase family 3 N-terminal domain-containing protein [Actinomycetota bacterium]